MARTGKTYPGWGQWTNAKEYLVEYALYDTPAAVVNFVLKRKTVRQALALSDDHFSFLRSFMDEKNLVRHVEIGYGDYDYGDDIVSCAGAAFVRGDLSLATLTALCDLHANRVDPDEVLLPEVASKVQKQPVPAPMLPGLPDLMPEGANGIGVSQSRKVVDFFLRAWRERWPLQAEGQAPRKGESIRSCAVAKNWAHVLRTGNLSRPCIYRWFEC